MFRYKDYIPLPPWSDGEPGSPYRNAKNPVGDRRRRIGQGIVSLSVLVNLYFLYATFTSWPAPLDNYQALNTHPILDTKALVAIKPANSQDNVIVTGLYTDAFATAVATLGHTLNVANSSAARLLYYLPDKVSERALCIATVSGWEPVRIERIAPPFRGVHRHFLDQYSKLHLWTLDQRGYQSVMYVDSDTIVRRNFDEVFRLPYTFAAVPDVYTDSQGYVTAFNAGVMFLRPDTELFHDMVSKIATAHYPAEQAEQAFLNHYFGAEVLRLPYAYNGNLAIKKRTPKLWTALQDEMRIMHLTMAKPFLQGDYAEVAMDQLERNAERVARKKPVFKEEIAEWVEAWLETRRTYASKLVKCNAL
ncbi:nucleotide-diphospho-sugar transferase [Dichomitus squalens LYAD-421 SS1]|uniref:Nucleotide-diphospho-sugar transferase n=1 Tax=Dichomitus squalens (strain LYAD-421) TaxID=732165 RepID=R7SPD3_DICSQ|nr:nucleotide-diphospho-sugar transferase [Dichomitus squalens LYAD-421 SS1]EJF56837.1 nucleotide-diphospho-sugar transferase [Dichomitus squalens LYAD-421 SS1]